MSEDTVLDDLVRTGTAEEIVPFLHLAMEDAQRDRQATDALFLTFNVDLAFLEARLLGLCHAAGARVTVVADGSVWNPDVRSVRFAGRHYHVGLADTVGAFHPKLTLLVGSHRAVAVVGSGNLTLGGWQYNAELATVLSADRTQAPQAMHDLRDALQSLVQRTRFDPTTTSAIGRSVDQLTVLLDRAEIVEAGHRIAASWDGPLIEHIPQTAVEELSMTAPFHDPAASAVGTLLGRLQPRRVRLAVQPGWTELNPTALRGVLDRHARAHDAGVEIVRDAEDPDGGRYRHGKLIEWVVDGRRYAMTGSPNLSVAALRLDAPVAGGNHELAVIGPIATSLFPAGEHIDLDQVPEPAALDQTEHAGPRGPLITAVVLTDSGLRLHIARVRWPVEVQVARLTDQPDAWANAASIEAGASLVELDLPVAGGSRVRLAWTDEDGQRRHSMVHFVTDPRTTTRRPGQGSSQSKTHRARPDDLTSDDLSFLASVMGDLTALADELAARRALDPTPAPDQDGTGDRAGAVPQDDRHVEPWLWIQSDTLDRLGPGLAAYALGLPPLPAETTDWAPDYIDTAVPDTEVGLGDDTAEATEDLEPADPFGAAPEGDQSGDAEWLRKGRRRWCERGTVLAPSLPVQLRLLVLRVTLRLWRTKNWPEHDPAPLQLIAQLVRSLDVNGVPPQLEARVSSLTAIALTFMRENTDLTVHDEQTLTFNRLLYETEHLLVAADEEVTETYLDGLVRSDRTERWLYEIAELEEDAASGDPLAEVEDTLSLDYDITRPGPRQLCFTGRLGNPVQRALEAIGQAEDHDRIAIWGSNHQGDWALVVWARPDLVTVTQRHGKPRRWRHQKLTPLIGPAALARQAWLSGGTSQYDIVTTPKHRVTNAALAVLACVGIEDPEPPHPSP